MWLTLVRLLINTHIQILLRLLMFTLSNNPWNINSKWCKPIWVLCFILSWGQSESQVGINFKQKKTCLFKRCTVIINLSNTETLPLKCACQILSLQSSLCSCSSRSADSVHVAAECCPGGSSRSEFLPDVLLWYPTTHLLRGHRHITYCRWVHTQWAAGTLSRPDLLNTHR